MTSENSIYSEDVKRISFEGKEIILVGTAHISKKSAELATEIIEREDPDTVCVELDEQRYKALSERKKWENLNIRSVIKQKQLSTLLINILLAAYQKKLGEKLGVLPGIELLAACNTAKEKDIPISLCDRDIRITLRRAWNSMSFFQKLKLMATGMFGIFEKEEITEEKLEELKRKDVLNEMMGELGKNLPVLKRVLIDERDYYLAEKIKKSEGQRIVAVVGAGHLQGIISHFTEPTESDLEEISRIPAGSSLFKLIGWGVPAVILLSILYIGITKGIAEAGDNIIFWILANGIPCGIGTAISLAHPLTIITAFIAAPFTSLTPVIGAGYVAAFVQAYLQPPIVKEFEMVSDDINKISKWWSNRLLKIFLVFILAGLGSVLGTYVGAYEILKNVIN